MNLYQIRREFEKANRSAGLNELDSYRDDWINAGWERICELFVIPSLVKTVAIDAVADQQFYLMPLDYSGTEVSLMYLNRRLDPIPDENLKLKYERRTGNRGRVEYWDWQQSIQESFLIVENCTLTNGSKTILMSNGDVVLNESPWVRFDPYMDEANTTADNDGEVDPQDYAYQIEAGTLAGGTSFDLTTEYRGPTGSNFVCRVRPEGQQQFKTYGTPAASEVGAFSMTYPANPRRLYNNSDTPEWSNMGRPIAYMAASLGLEWLHAMELSKTFWGRAMSRVRDLERRRNSSQAQVSDMTIGTTIGRKTGMRSVRTGGNFSRSRGY